MPMVFFSRAAKIGASTAWSQVESSLAKSFSSAFVRV